LALAGGIRWQDWSAGTLLILQTTVPGYWAGLTTEATFVSTRIAEVSSAAQSVLLLEP
jgi:hypothetical protein